MGVYIKMEMPKSCSECFMNFCDGRKTVVHFAVERGDNCPLVPVPPHGRLIDKDAIRKKCEHGEYPNVFIDPPELAAEFYAAPTIIPAEPPEEGET